MKHITPLQAHELSIQRAPDHFSVAAFLGKGEYDRASTVSFNRAVDTARHIYRNRPVAIYAVKGSSQSHLANYEPNKGIIVLYLITWDRDAFAVQRFLDRAAAERTAAGLPELTSNLIVEKLEDLGNGGPWLVKVYNHLNPGSPVARFATIADAKRRVFASLEGLDTPPLNVPAGETAITDQQGASTATVEKPEGAGDAAEAAARHDATHEEEADLAVKKTKTPRKAKTKRAATERTNDLTKLVRPAGKVSDLKMIRDASRRADLLKRLDGKHDAEQIIKELKIDFGTLNSYCRFFSTIGIGIDVSEKGCLTAVYPDSKTIADVIASKEV